MALAAAIQTVLKKFQPARRSVDFRSLPLERSVLIEGEDGAITHRVEYRRCPHTGLRIKGTYRV